MLQPRVFLDNAAVSLQRFGQPCKIFFGQASKAEFHTMRFPKLGAYFDEHRRK